METKRVEVSKQRLMDKMSEGKKYLEKETNDMNELAKLKNNLEKKKTQFEKDIIAYETSTDKNEEKVSEYEETQIEAGDTSDDLGHYINVEEQKKLEPERNLQRQAEEKKLKLEMEKRRLEAEGRDKDRQFQLEKERMELEQKRISISIEEKIPIEKLQVKKKKVEVMKEKDKLTVKLPKLDPKKFDGNILKWTEFWVVFEATIHNNKGLHAVDKFNCLKSQLYGNASEVISGLELTKDNYYVAIDLLKERYGKKQIMVNAYYAKSVATFKSASLRSFYDTTEKHLRCLYSLGQDNNQMQVLSMMQLKLPRRVLVKLEEMKPEGEEWTVENF